MRLTHIKLTGFKSFTDPTTIHIPGQLVAVIGPNGCGKSNVIDAVRWVLGEASAKQLRGESMQDVIFNGAATRRPAPRAMVELVFNNTDQSLQGPWGKYAEVSIKRQITRQGESTYYINNQVVRRRDITDLFLGTGVGARGYAVIEQGMISRIIEARPEELRAYIEEAAGVSKYKERRKETENRLKDTREHLQRLSDLQSELSRQVEKLEKQAETAARYRTLTEQLTKQQDLLDYTHWQQSLAAADKATEQHQISLQKQDELSAQNRATGEALHALRENEQQQQQQAQDISNQRAMLREQIARLEEQLRSQHNLQQRIQRDKLAAQAQLQRIHQEQQNIRSELEALEAELEEKQIELSDWAMQVAEREESLPELEAEQHTLTAALQSQQDELNRIKRELALKQQQLAHTLQTLQQNASRREKLHQENQSLNLPADTETEAAQQHAALLQAQHEHYEQQLLESEERHACLKQDFQTGSNHYNALYQQHLGLQAEQQALATLLKNSSQTEDFWQHLPHTAQTALWQHIKAPESWQHALSVVLAARLHARALPHDFSLPEPLPAGQAAWFRSDLSPAKKTQPAQALINQIQAEPPYQAALTYWLDGILCAPTLDYALQQQERLQAHQCWLTPEGHQVDRIGVVLYAEHNDNNLIELKNRYDKLTEELEAFAPKLTKAEQQSKAAAVALEKHEVQHKQWQTQHRQHTLQLQSAQARATELLARTNQGQLRREHIEQELAQLEEQQLISEQSSHTLQDDIAELTEAATELEHQQTGLNEQRQTQQNQLKQAQLALLEANRRYGAVEVAVYKQQQRKQSLQQQLTSLEQQTLDWQERQSELALAYETEQQDSEQREKLEILAEQVATLETQYLAAQECLSEIQRQGRELYASQQTLAAALPQLQAATQTALLQQQEALINAKRYHQNLEEREADFDALEQLAKEAGSDLKTLSGGIQSLTQQIEALGAVNLAALQELEEARERDGYYRSQSEDVQAAIGLLEEAIGQIDNETKQRFKETFDAVNEKMQTFFPTLFGGGEASLQMIGDDLLTAGVSITARPPGKKNSTIHLLSGGEKALTAMSLVFALFSLNPAPFCLLDEVDAPLDDANTSRFCHLVKEMSAQTQFLYISHNRLTMEMAEQLIGVTMQEKGVSRIVAVDIQQALSMAEA
ncbi:MAG: chromosome segregation protein SMC [Neisseria sp.]|uniref:chromosome segregation protein SMC n=1 Tax=Neisseria sp. TaxID=192066 RepID=UPI0026DBEAC8|nr:chromosome segregation protein SMC [Neisseria sp.]MDO4640757.1 chromosome segregation protein SMC [Neisseria sp.]